MPTKDNKLVAPSRLLNQHVYPPSQNTNTARSKSNPNTKVQQQQQQRHLHRQRPKKQIPWRYIAYQFSFSVLIVLLAVLLLLSAFSIGVQIVNVGGSQRRGNIVVLSAAYFAVAIISIMHFWSRLLTIKRVLRTMPKPYMPTKVDDLENVVARHIASEYSRTAVIAHISQATTGMQEGWGRPGTKWAEKHFRTEILSTLPDIKRIFKPKHNDPASPQPPQSLAPLSQFAATSSDKALTLFINSYIRLIEQARYGRREPTEADAEAVIKVVEVIKRTMEVKGVREKAGIGRDRDK